MTDKQKASIKHLENIIDMLKKEKCEALEIEIISHNETILKDEVLKVDVPSGVYTFRMVYKEKKANAAAAKVLNIDESKNMNTTMFTTTMTLADDEGWLGVK